MIHTIKYTNLMGHWLVMVCPRPVRPGSPKNTKRRGNSFGWLSSLMAEQAFIFLPFSQSDLGKVMCCTVPRKDISKAAVRSKFIPSSRSGGCQPRIGLLWFNIERVF